MRIIETTKLYIARLIDEQLDRTLARFAAVLLVGPRAVGKTTTAQRVTRSVVRLDREREAEAFRADPDVALSMIEEPVLLDEWQEVPGVLGAVKRAVDADPRPGRFLLTGSVRADIDASTWPGTGRLIRVRMDPLTLPERTGVDLSGPRTVVDRLFDEGSAWLTGRRCELALDDYLRAALAGGWPALLHLDDAGRDQWLAAYVDQLVTRDARQLQGRRNPEALRRWLRAYASAVATVTDQKSIYDVAGIAKATAEAYMSLMEALLIVTPIPAWWTNELKRLAKRPKLHLADVALTRPLLGLDAAGALRDNRHGRVLEGFMAGQLRALAGVSAAPVGAYHLRQLDGREVDVVLERPDRRLVGIEVKATSAPARRHAKDLYWLRRQSGDRVAATILAHTGPAAFDLGDGVLACPMGTLLGVGSGLSDR